MQVAGQAALPSQTYGAHAGFCPALPAGRIVQVPFALAPIEAAHTSQPPAQALSQQYPSTQRPVAQTASNPHAAPCGLVRTARVTALLSTPFVTAKTRWGPGTMGTLSARLAEAEVLDQAEVVAKYWASLSSRRRRTSG